MIQTASLGRNATGEFVSRKAGCAILIPTAAQARFVMMIRTSAFQPSVFMIQTASLGKSAATMNARLNPACAIPIQTVIPERNATAPPTSASSLIMNAAPAQIAAPGKYAKATQWEPAVSLEGANVLMILIALPMNTVMGATASLIPAPATATQIAQAANTAAGTTAKPRAQVAEGEAAMTMMNAIPIQTAQVGKNATMANASLHPMHVILIPTAALESTAQATLV